MDSDGPTRHLIGKPPRHWLFDVSSATFDLTRPLPPSFPLPVPGASISIQTTSKTILVSPQMTALVIIDMQNFFLSTYLERPADGAGNKAAQKLLEVAIPAARSAGIQIIWLNWGFTESDLGEISPSLLRGFGFEASLESLKEEEPGNSEKLTENRTTKRIFKGLGSEIGSITTEDGKVINAGRLLMRDTWNADLIPPLKAAYEKGQLLKEKADVWIHKNRMSGFWGGTTPCTQYLEKEGIKTVLFAGVNTDQCVGGSLQDAFMKGWDCILLKDACGTTSPGFATECIEYNCARTMGFVTDCSALQRGVQNMLDVKQKVGK